MKASTIEAYLVGHVADWVDVAVSDVEAIGQGWESDIHGFVAKSPTASHDLVLRAYTGPGGEQKAVIEGRGMPRLLDANYPVPRVYHFETDRKALGLPFIIMERAEGTQLWPQMNHASESRRIALEHEFVDLVVKLHRVDPEPFLEELMVDVADPHQFTRRTFATWRSTVNDAPAAGFSAALDWFEANVANVAPLPATVVHNDFHPGNVLRTSSGETTVLDWTGLGVADPRGDLAWTLMLLEIYGDVGAASRVKDAYSDQLAAPDLDFFMAAAYMKRLYSLVISLTQGPEALGMRAEAEAAMRRELQNSGQTYGGFRNITGLRLPSFEELTDF